MSDPDPDEWIKYVDALEQIPNTLNQTQSRIDEDFGVARVLGRNDEEEKAGEALQAADLNHRLVVSALQRSVRERS